MRSILAILALCAAAVVAQGDAVCTPTEEANVQTKIGAAMPVCKDAGTECTPECKAALTSTMTVTEDFLKCIGASLAYFQRLLSVVYQYLYAVALRSWSRRV